MSKTTLKCFFIFLFLWSSTAIAQTETAPVTCGSTQSCGEFSNALGSVITGLGALFIPHLINGKISEFPSTLKNRYQIGFGQKNLKNLGFYYHSSPEYNQRFLIVTSFEGQLFDKNTPSIIRYAAGVGYNLKINEYLSLIPTGKIAFEFIESISATQVASEFGLLTNYSMNDRLNLIAEASILNFKDYALKASTGFSYKFYGINDAPILFTIGFEDNRFIRTKFYSLAVGFDFY